MRARPRSITTPTARHRRASDISIRDTGFSFTEFVIAIFVLAVFLTPLLRNFTTVRRFSLAARDTVAATSLALSCLGDLRTLPFGDLRANGPEVQARMRAFAATRLGPMTYRTTLDGIDEPVPGRVKMIRLTIGFTLPGETTVRTLSMRGFAHADQR